MNCEVHRWTETMSITSSDGHSIKSISEGIDVMNNYMEDRWSKHLPKELIEQIAKRLSRVSDSVRMAAVCRSWRSAVARCLMQPTSSQEFLSIPWIIQSHDCSTSTKVRCSLYSPSDNRIYHTLDRFARFPAPPPEEEEIGNKRDVHNRAFQCLGSVDGWLIVVVRTWNRISRTTGIESAMVSHYFFNLMTGDHVMLPPQSTIPFNNPKKSYLSNMVASSAPKSSSSSAAINPNCIVAAITSEGYGLVFCRPTDEKWTYQRSPRRICELVFHEDGKLYALPELDIQSVVVFDPLEVLSVSDQGSTTNSYKGKTLFVELPDRMARYRPLAMSLVRSSKGEVIMFWRNQSIVQFEVLKLMLDKDESRRPRWARLKKHDLEDEAIFIGDGGGNTSVPISKLTNSSSNLEFLGVGGGGGNCIWFTDETDRKISVYNIADRTLLKYPPSKRSASVLKPNRTRVWFTPKPVVKDYSYTIRPD